jgi:hypothetical protein
MNQEMKRKVIMLPTKENSYMGFLTEIGKKRNDLRYFGRKMPIILDSENQHLYIVSEDEITEERLRWIIDYRDGMNGFIHQVSSILDSKLCPEIIATTHNSLNIHWNINDHKSLPQLSKTFIEMYVEEYKKGNVITNVMVEYDIAYNCDGDDAISIRTDSSNDIIVRPTSIKETWNREEVKNILFMYADENALLSNKYDFDNFNNFIENNL